jgi:excisionase family DNA binding protein
MESEPMTPEEVAKWLGVSEDKLRRMRAKGLGPPYVKIDGVIRYDKQTVHQWWREVNDGRDTDRDPSDHTG